MALNQIGQIALPSLDVDRSEAFYASVLGLRKLYRFGNLCFFDCAGVRLMISPPEGPEPFRSQGCIYFRCPDIALTANDMKKHGAIFSTEPHLIASLDDHDLWMAFFNDPDGHIIALMQEAPKGYTPPKEN